MTSHRAKVRQDIIDYLNTHPNCTFEDMVRDWIAEGKTLHSGLLRDFAAEVGLLSRFSNAKKDNTR